MTKRFLPTKEQCDLIVNSNPSFIYKQEFIDGQEAAIYDYRLASYTDFLNPVPDQPEIEGFELRGLTFLKQSDGAWTRYLSMHKFFNVGEVWSINDLRQMRLTGVYPKEDGSLIRFIRTEKRNVFAKTKKTFFSEQAEMANDIFRNCDQVLCSPDINYGLFELCSPNNRVVVHYPETTLKKLWHRFDDGSYLCSRIRPYNLEATPLDYLLEQAKDVTGIEGWVLTFDPGDGSKLFLKLKTAWYLNLHRMISNVNSDKQIIEATLNDRIDDMMQVIQDIPGLADAVRAKQKKVLSYYYEQLQLINKALWEYPECDSRKTFYLAFKDYDFIGLIMSVVSGIEKGVKTSADVIEERLKQEIIKKFGAEKDAKRFFN